MSLVTDSKKRAKSYFSNSTLILVAFATCFFARNISALGIPAVINFFHFVTVPLACFFSLRTTKIKNRSQIANVKSLLTGLLTLLGVMLASTIVNDAGIINLVLDFMMLAEPFMLLVAVIAIPMSAARLAQFQFWIMGFCFFHIFSAISQYYLLILGVLKKSDMTLGDNVQGVFYFSNGGHVVGASVATTFGLYYLFSAKSAPVLFRIFVVLASVYHLLLADAKQVMLVMFLAWFLLILTKLKDIRKMIQYLIAAVIVVYGFVWCIQNVEIFRHFNTWIRPGLYGPNGTATLLKTSSFGIINSYFESPLNWLFGLGPGHTVGRLGGWMLGGKFGKYWGLLRPFGATKHPASDAVWAAWDGHWLNSTIFSPLFGWVGIWGDLGLMGLCVYLLLWVIVWQKICLDDFSKFTLLNVLIHGFIFTQMEEPGYMLFVMLLIGLRWHQKFKEALPKHS